MTAVDKARLQRFLGTELYERLVEYYRYGRREIQKPDFKIFYHFLSDEALAEFDKHPAKMNPWLAANIWRGVEQDSSVLDPMCGVGGTVIPGLLLTPPRTLLLNDIVPEYVELAKSICEGVVEALGLQTRVEAYTANAATLFERIGRKSVDVIITSPPYGAFHNSDFHPYRKTYRGGGWGDLATFSNGHYRAAWLQLLAGFYLLLGQRGICRINIKNTRTNKQRLQPLTEITAKHMEYIGFHKIAVEEFPLAYESPYVRGRRLRGEDVSHLLKEYVIQGEKP
jgi:DNA modification methylase